MKPLGIITSRSGMECHQCAHEALLLFTISSWHLWMLLKFDNNLISLEEQNKLILNPDKIGESWTWTLDGLHSLRKLMTAVARSIFAQQLVSQLWPFQTLHPVLTVAVNFIWACPWKAFRDCNWWKQYMVVRLLTHAKHRDDTMAVLKDLL